MARGRPRRRKGKGILAWRSRQKRGAIMRPSTFKRIVRKNIRKYGKRRARKIAGKAYWRTAKAKYRRRRRRRI